MASLVLDTHAAIWFFEVSPRLSTEARERLNGAAAEGDRLLLPSICLVEMVYLQEKGRISGDYLSGIWDLLRDPLTALEAVPLSSEIAKTMALIPRIQVPDMPDRIIAATALHLGLPLVSADRRIRTTDLEVIW